MPSFNSAPFLRQALDSVLDQITGPHEVLVQDGGSAVETIEILQSYGDRVSWVSAPDRGQSDALNKALARATGDVIVWVNADDILLPGALDAAAAAFASDMTLTFAYGDFDIIDGSGVLVRAYKSSEYSWPRVYSKGCYIFSGSLFVRRSTLVELGGYDTSLQACMDLDLLLRLGGAGRSRHLRRTIGQLRMHGSNKSSSITPVFLVEAFRVRRRHAGGSARLFVSAIRAAAVSALLLGTTRLRLSPRWPRHGRTKSL